MTVTIRSRIPVIGGGSRFWKSSICNALRHGATRRTGLKKNWHSVVELGAGVGSASRQIALPTDVDYLRTDKNPFLLRGDLQRRVTCYDFDTPSTLRNVDSVFAGNALHCARDYRASLSHVYETLRNGGTFLLAQWISDLEEVGFRSIEWRCLQAGEHDLGGLIWGRK